MKFVEKLLLTLQSGQFDKWASRVTDVGNGCHYQSEQGPREMTIFTGPRGEMGLAFG